MEHWGRVPSAPYFLRSRLLIKKYSRHPHKLFVPIVDLPGEMVEKTAEHKVTDNLTSEVIEQLKNTHHFLAVVGRTSFYVTL